MSAIGARARARALGIVGVGVATVIATSASAKDPPSGLVVERANGAARCPDASGLEALVRAHLGEGDHAAKLGQLRVRFEPSGTGHRAIVRIAEGAERILDDPDPRCVALATGLAITAAALLDDAERDPPAPTTEPPPRSPKPPPRPRYSVLPAIDRTPAFRPAPRPVAPVSLSMGARLSSGILQSDTTALDVLTDLHLPDITLGAGLQWAPDDRLVHPDYVIRYAYVVASARVCYRRPWEEEFGAGLCGLVRIGERTANQDPAGESTSGLWVAPGAELDVSRRVVGPVGLYATFASTVPVVANPIDLDLRVEPSRVPVTVELAVGLRVWFDAFERPQRFDDVSDSSPPLRR